MDVAHAPAARQHAPRLRRARHDAVYRGGPLIWVAPTADDSDGWLATMRHVAIESGAFVVSVPQYIPGAAFPEGFPVPVERAAHPRSEV